MLREVTAANSLDDSTPSTTKNSSMSNLLNSMLSSLSSTPVPSLTSLASTTKYQKLNNDEEEEYVEEVIDDIEIEQYFSALKTSLPISVVNLTSPGIILEYSSEENNNNLSSSGSESSFIKFELPASTRASEQKILGLSKSLSPSATSLPLSFSVNSFVEVTLENKEKQHEKNDVEIENLKKEEKEEESDQVAKRSYAIRITPSSITHELDANTVTYAKIKMYRIF